MGFGHIIQDVSNAVSSVTPEIGSVIEGVGPAMQEAVSHLTEQLLENHVVDASALTSASHILGGDAAALTDSATPIDAAHVQQVVDGITSVLDGHHDASNQSGALHSETVSDDHVAVHIDTPADHAVAAHDDASSSDPSASA